MISLDVKLMKDQFFRVKLCSLRHIFKNMWIHHKNAKSNFELA